VGRDNRPVRYVVCYLPAFVYLRTDENNVGKLPRNLVVGAGLTSNRWWISTARARFLTVK
jgi:hypothetical protein